MRAIRSILFGLAFLALFEVSGQKKFTNTELASSLKAEYEDEDFIIRESASSFDFQVKDGNVHVVQRDILQLITLESNLNYHYNIFYNDNISLGKTSLGYSSGRGVLKDSHSCGNYEVDNVFYSDARVCAYTIELLYEGSEVTIESERTFEDARYLTKVFFHEQDPALKRQISFMVPESLEVEFIRMNFDEYDVITETEPADNGTRYTFTLEDLDAMKDEENSLGILHEYPHLIVATKSVRTAAGPSNILASVDDLYSWYASLVSEVDTDRSAFTAKVQELTGNAKTDEEKIRAVYYWVQENIKYIAFEDGIAGFQPESAGSVFANRYGDCKGMSMLTREMLREAGLDVRLAWLGTNRIPYTYDLPSLAVDNHVICVVYAGGKEYIIDPTERFSALGDHAERIQGKELLIENGDEYIRHRVPVAPADRNQWLRTEELTLKDGVISGKGTIGINGESKNSLVVIWQRIEKTAQDRLLKRLAVSEASNSDEVTIGEVTEFEREKPFEMEYAFSLANKSSAFGSDLYVDLDWDDSYTGIELDEDRVTGYYFGRKVKDRTVKHLSVPAGYKVTHLPSDIDLTHNDITIRIRFSHNGKRITYIKEFIVESGVISKTDFETWNNFVRQMKEVHNDQIVLTKIR